MLFITIIFMMLLLIYLGITIFYIYNKIIKLKTYAEKAYANIDVLLLKRSELIPQLLNLDQAQENQLNDLMQLQLQLGINQINNKVDIHNQITIFLQHNGVQGSDHQLKHLNEGIAHRIEIYNESVLLYNSCFAAFPYSYFVKILNVSPMERLKVFS